MDGAHAGVNEPSVVAFGHLSSPSDGATAIVDERVVSILDVQGILRDKGLDIPAGPAHAYSARMLGVTDISPDTAL